MAQQSLQDIQANLKTLQERIKTEGITTASGQLINPIDYNKPITADMMASTEKPITFPEPPDFPKPPTIPNASLAYTPPKTEDASLDFMKKYLEVPGPQSPLQDYFPLREQAGIESRQSELLASQQAKRAAETELSNISNKLNLVAQRQTLERQQLDLGLSKEGISADAIGGRRIAFDREQALRDNTEIYALNSQSYMAQSKVAQASGDVQTAQTLLGFAQNEFNTLFKIQTDYETAVYNYQKDLRDKFWDYATEKEKRLFALQDKEDKQNQSIYNNAINDIRQITQTAISNGDANTASQIAQLASSLNPNSKTFQTDIARVNNEMAVLQGQIKPKTPTPVPTTLTSDIENYALNLNAGQVKIANVPQAIRGQVLAKAKDFAVEDMKEDIITGISQNAFKDKNNAISQLRNVYPEFTKEEIEKEVNSLFESTITPIKESQGGVAKAVGGFFGGVAKAVGGFFNRLFGK